MKTRIWWVLYIAVLRGQSPPQSCALDRALQFHQSGDYPAAIREYQACIAAEPDRFEARSNLGAVLAKLGRYQEAIDQYREALKTAPPSAAPPLHFNLALSYYKSFQIPKAVAEFEDLHRARPSDANTTLLLADCRLRTGEFQRAIDLLLPIESAQPDQPALDYLLGMALIRAGRVADGQQRVDRILGHGESAEGHLLLGVALFTGGDFPAALKEFAKSESLNPELPSLHSYYGQALLFTGDPDAATREFRKELALNPNDFDANLQLASILSHRGQTADARPLLERAVQLRPGSSEARDALRNGFSIDKPGPGDAGVAVGSPAPPIGTFQLNRLPKPTVLVFGSYTCPKLRSAAGELKRLFDQHHDRIDFRLVYIREAHAGEQWQSTVNVRDGIAVAPASSLPEKQAHAELCLRKLNFPFPALVDGMDAAAETAYQAWPSRLYLIDRNGRVAFNTRLGELDFRPRDLEAAIREILTNGGPDVRPR